MSKRSSHSSYRPPAPNTLSPMRSPSAGSAALSQQKVIGFSGVVAKYDRYSYRQLLQEKGWTATDIELFGSISGIESYLDIGAIDMFLEDASRFLDDTSL